MLLSLLQQNLKVLIAVLLGTPVSSNRVTLVSPSNRLGKVPKYNRIGLQAARVKLTSVQLLPRRSTVLSYVRIGLVKLRLEEIRRSFISPQKRRNTVQKYPRISVVYSYTRVYVQYKYTRRAALIISARTSVITTQG